jgi:hypothetical protein
MMDQLYVGFVALNERDSEQQTGNSRESMTEGERYPYTSGSLQYDLNRMQLLLTSVGSWGCV